MTWRRRLLRLYWIALVLWGIALVLTVTLFGGISSPVTAINIVLTFLVIASGILAAWLEQREQSRR